MERRSRLCMGVFDHWHKPEVEVVREEALASQLISISDWWSNWKVAQGLWCELGLPLAYIGSHVLAHRRIGWWIVALTLYVVEVPEY